MHMYMFIKHCTRRYDKTIALCVVTFGENSFGMFKAEYKIHKSYDSWNWFNHKTARRIILEQMNRAKHLQKDEYCWAEWRRRCRLEYTNIPMSVR